jgi:hypothetical protein
MSTVKATNFQNASSATANMVTDASGNVSFGGTAAMSSSFLRNRIINGDMRIDQRNAGAEVNPAASGIYYLDRWLVQSTAASKFKIGQNAGAVTPPTGYTKYLGCTSLSAYTVGASEAFNIQQRIEGFNISDLAWGTASAASITISFWVQSSLTGTFGGCLNNSGSSRNYPFTYTISVANTWEQKTITIAGDTSGTWLTTNGQGVGVVFSLGAGATLSGTAGAWSSTASLRSATGATSVVGTSGATFYVTGVQLEVGTVATPFERQIYNAQLVQCQRYYQQYASGQGAIFRGLPQTLTTGNTFAWMPFLVVKRAAPTMSVGTPYYNNMSTATWGNITLDGAEIQLTVTAANSYAFIPWTAESEL